MPIVKPRRRGVQGRGSSRPSRPIRRRSPAATYWSNGLHERLDVAVVAVGEQVEAVDAERLRAVSVLGDLRIEPRRRHGWPTTRPIYGKNLIPVPAMISCTGSISVPPIR